MTFFSMLTTLVGVFVSILSSMICYLGGAPLSGQLNWVPCSDLLFIYPGASLGIGGFMIVLGIFCHPSRIH